MSKTKAERLQEVHARAIKHFDKVYSVQQDIRQQCLEDRRFVDVDGAQWEDSLGQQFENRPRMEIDKIAASVDRTFNEYRANRITVDFKPKGDSADDDTADLLDDLYRSDELESCAQEAYDNAVQEGTKGGIGAWRLRAIYEDESDEDDDAQRIAIEPIYDADVCVFFDIDAKRYDKADARRAWLLYSMSRDAFEEEYPDQPANSLDRVDRRESFDWFQPDVVWCAEYYEKEERAETVVTFELSVDPNKDEPTQRKHTEDELEESPELVEELEVLGFVEVKRKKVKRTHVHKYVINGACVLEDCGVIAGDHIPIVPYFGNRSFVSNVERARGKVRKAKDAQRIYNMQLSTLAEMTALSPYEKPIFTQQQIQGHEYAWASDNVRRGAYLLINPILDASGNPNPVGPIGYTKPPAVPQPLAALIEVANRDIKDVTGNRDESQQIASNVAAEAMQMVQDRSDMGDFGYMDNMAKSMRRCGEIWLSMRRDIETKRRKVRRVAADGAMSSDEILVPAMDDKGGEYVKHDLSAGKFDVVVDVGPSFSSKRDRTIQSLINVLQYVQDPQQRTVLTMVILQQMEGEGLSELRTHFRKQLVIQGIYQPTDEEKEMLAQLQAKQRPDPNALYLEAAAQSEQAKAQKAQADTVKALADAERAKAETAKTLASIDSERIDQVTKGVELLTQRSDESVTNPSI